MARHSCTIVASMYNARPEILEVIERLFLPSLIRNASSDLQFVLLDDASPLREQTERVVARFAPELRAAFGDFQFVRNPRNLGFAGSYNRGMRRAEGEHVVLLNDDVYLPRGSLQRLLEVLRSEPGAGLVGPVTNWVCGYQNTHLFPRLRDLSPSELERIERFAERLRRCVGWCVIPVPRLIGFCLVISGDLIRDIGYLDESFAHGLYEDDDYCLRARKAGYRILLDASTFVEHGGPRGGGMSFRQQFLKTLAAAFANGARLARKHDLPLSALVRQSIEGFVQFFLDWNTVTARLRPYWANGMEDADA
jgi:GT2 family glycosyltransferase